MTAILRHWLVETYGLRGSRDLYLAEDRRTIARNLIGNIDPETKCCRVETVGTLPENLEVVNVPKSSHCNVSYVVPAEIAPRLRELCQKRHEIDWQIEELLEGSIS